MFRSAIAPRRAAHARTKWLDPTRVLPSCFLTLPKTRPPGYRLCKGYAAHHFDSVANSLHAGGMTAGLVSAGVGLFAKHLTPLERVVSVMWHVPQWYLFAWVGHFGLQKDVPAVFTYGSAEHDDPNLNTRPDRPDTPTRLHALSLITGALIWLALSLPHAPSTDLTPD